MSDDAPEADEALGFDEGPGFSEDVEPTLVSTDLSALRLALQQRRIGRATPLHGSDASPAPAADANEPGPPPSPVPSGPGAEPDPKRSSTLVFDALSIRRALDDLQDGGAGSEVGAPASDEDLGAGRTGAESPVGDVLRSTGLLGMRHAADLAGSAPTAEADEAPGAHSDEGPGAHSDEGPGDQDEQGTGSVEAAVAEDRSAADPVDGLERLAATEQGAGEEPAVPGDDDQEADSNALSASDRSEDAEVPWSPTEVPATAMEARAADSQTDMAQGAPVEVPGGDVEADAAGAVEDGADDALVSEAAGPHAPDVAAPDAAAPDVAAPDAATPDVAAPDAAAPDVEDPDAADTTGPDAGIAVDPGADGDPLSIHLSETLLIGRDVAFTSDEEEEAADAPEEAAPWEEGAAEPRVGTLVLTSDAFAEALSAVADDAPFDDDDDSAHGQQPAGPASSVGEVLLDDPDAPVGPVQVVADRTEMTPFGDAPPPEPDWTAGPGAESGDDLSVSPERFWPGLGSAQDDRTSVEPMSMDDDGPATTSAVPRPPVKGSMGETSPGFGIGAVDIDDLDPNLRATLQDRSGRARDQDDRSHRMTSPQVDAPWTSRAREMDTHILAMDAADEPAWTDGPGEDVSRDLDERSVRGPVGPAVARPPEESIARAARPPIAPSAPPAPDAASSDAVDFTLPATSFLRAMVVLGLLVLLGAFAVPSVVAGSLTAPWKIVADVQSLSFLCALLFGIDLIVAILPMPLVARASLLTAAAAAHLAFGAILLRDAALRFAFHGHPAIDGLFAVGVVPTFVALLAAVVLPAGLYARGRYTASLGARVTVGVGLALALLVLLGWGAIAPGSGEVPLVALFSQVFGGESLQGDRLASMVALVGVAALLLSGLAFLGPRRTGLVSLWAFLWSFALGAALIVEAVHVAHLEQWREVLEPTKLAVFVAAGLLLAPVALGTLIGALAPGRAQRK